MDGHRMEWTSRFRSQRPMIDRIRRLLAPAVLLALVDGCGNEGPPGAGLTNGPPPAGSEKPAVRTDLPTPPPPDRGEIVGEFGDDQTTSGPGGRGGGREGGYPDQPKPKQGDPD